MGLLSDIIKKMSELNSKQKGNLTELKCLAAFVEQGITVSIPYGDCARYDFIADIEGKLYKIQCKTSNLESEGVYKFACKSTTGNTLNNTRRKYDENQIDFFATIIEDKCCLIPVQETGGSSKTLRINPPKNNAVKNISFVKDYLLQKQLLEIKERI